MVHASPLWGDSCICGLRSRTAQLGLNPPTIAHSRRAGAWRARRCPPCRPRPTSPFHASRTQGHVCWLSPTLLPCPFPPPSAPTNGRPAGPRAQANVCLAVNPAGAAARTRYAGRLLNPRRSLAIPAPKQHEPDRGTRSARHGLSRAQPTHQLSFREFTRN